MVCKHEAARALTQGNTNTINHRLETAKWLSWCLVSDDKLLKRVRKMNSKGQRIGFEFLQCGEVLTNDNTLVANYWDKPQKIDLTDDFTV